MREARVKQNYGDSFSLHLPIVYCVTAYEIKALHKNRYYEENLKLNFFRKWFMILLNSLLTLDL